MFATTPQERHHRLEACAKEPWTVSWIETMEPGEVLYDVGASTGPYSLVAGSRGVRVFAFEPAYASYPRLYEHILLNRLSALVTALPFAVSSRTGLGLMQYASRHPGFSGHSFQPEADTTDTGTELPILEQLVPSFRMDDLPAFDGRIRPPNHVKLDVDGAEAAVLEGARGTLASPGFRSLLLEMDHRHEADLVALARDLGLRLAQRFEASSAPWVSPSGRRRLDTAYGLFFRRSP